MRVSIPDGIKRREFEDKYGHGTAVMLRLCKDYFGTNRVGYGDAFFSSVECALTLRKQKLFFTGVVKICAADYPAALIESGTLGSGASKTYSNKRGVLKFISTHGTSLEGNGLELFRYRPVNSTSIVSQKKTIPIFGIINVGVDEHNRMRSGMLSIERKVKIREFEYRVNTTLIGMIMT
eukprot:Pgem_evm1s11477